MRLGQAIAALLSPERAQGLYRRRFGLGAPGADHVLLADSSLLSQGYRHFFPSLQALQLDVAPGGASVRTRLRVAGKTLPAVSPARRCGRACRMARPPAPGSRPTGTPRPRCSTPPPTQAARRRQRAGRGEGAVRPGLGDAALEAAGRCQGRVGQAGGQPGRPRGRVLVRALADAHAAAGGAPARRRADGRGRSRPGPARAVADGRCRAGAGRRQGRGRRAPLAAGRVPGTPTSARTRTEATG